MCRQATVAPAGRGGCLQGAAGSREGTVGATCAAHASWNVDQSQGFSKTLPSLCLCLCFKVSAVAGHWHSVEQPVPSPQ